jgi:hypothetical protein
MVFLKCNLASLKTLLYYIEYIKYYLNLFKLLFSNNIEGFFSIFILFLGFINLILINNQILIFLTSLISYNFHFLIILLNN